MPELKILLGAEKFAELRRSNFYYADKTAFLEKFLSSGKPNVASKVALFTRPRRFGKTLFMSMLAEFFDITRDSRELFEGLAVSRNKRLCEEWMNRYPVISLNLKGVGGLCFEDAFAKFHNQILKCVSGYYRFYEDPAVTPQDRLYLNAILQQKAGKSELAKALCTMSRALAGYYKRPVIVLIDEYDTPVVNAARGGYYNEMVDFVRDFFGYTFAANAALKFGVLTGVMPITKESLFGGLDSLRHYGVSDSDYADIFGFTQDEVDTLLDKAGLSSKREEVRAWYGGYSFGGTQEMYCPWNILNYVVDHKNNPQLEPKAYWLDTSGNELVQRLVAQTLADPHDIDALLDGGTLAARLHFFPECRNLSRDSNLVYPFFHRVSDKCPARREKETEPARLGQRYPDHSQQGSGKDLHLGVEGMVLAQPAGLSAHKPLPGLPECGCQTLCRASFRQSACRYRLARAQ